MRIFSYGLLAAVMIAMLGVGCASKTATTSTSQAQPQPQPQPQVVPQSSVVDKVYNSQAEATADPTGYNQSIVDRAAAENKRPQDIIMEDHARWMAAANTAK